MRCFLLVSLLAAAPAWAQAPDSLAAADSAAVVQVAEGFHQALAHGDSLAVASLLLPDALVLEGGMPKRGASTSPTTTATMWLLSGQ